MPQSLVSLSHGHATRLSTALHLASCTTSQELHAFCASPSFPTCTALLTQPLDLSSLTPDESALCALLETLITSSPHSAQRTACHIAAALFKPPFLLPRHFDLPAIPEPLHQPYIHRMAQSPHLFADPSYASLFIHFFHAWLSYLLAFLDGFKESPAYAMVLNHAATTIQSTALFMTDDNTKPLFQLRAKLLEKALTDLSFPLTHTFPKRSKTPSSVSIAFFLGNAVPSAELFAFLSALQGLSSKFRKTVYVITAGNPDFEAHITNAGAELVVLPSAIKAQISAVRSRNHDVAFFASNLASAITPLTVLAAHRVARLQVTSVATMTTTAFTNMDAYISSLPCEPSPSPQDHYTEKLILLPTLAHCFHHPAIPLMGVSDASSLVSIPPSITQVFASCTNIHKVTPPLLDAWARILAAAPGSALMLFPYNPTWSSTYPRAAFVAAIHTTLARHRVDPARLTLIDIPNLNRHGVRSLLRKATVYLDSFPFSGSTSLIEPLELPIPVVTLQGSSMRAAMGASFLRSLGLDDLVATTSDHYIALAVRLATDPHHHATTTDRLRAAMAASPAFLDVTRYGQALEAALLRALDA